MTKTTIGEPEITSLERDSNESLWYLDLPQPRRFPALSDVDGIREVVSQEQLEGYSMSEVQEMHSRTYWDAWRCATEGCDFVSPVRHQVHSAGSLLSDNTSEYSGRALLLNTCCAPIVEHKAEFFGY